MAKKEFCQSCAMPLDNGGENMRGSNKDQSSSNIYCKYCFENGEFIQKDITYEQMLQKGIDAIEKGNKGKLTKWMMKKSYPMLLKNQSRWKK